METEVVGAGGGGRGGDVYGHRAKSFTLSLLTLPLRTSLSRSLLLGLRLRPSGGTDSSQAPPRTRSPAPSLCARTRALTESPRLSSRSRLKVRVLHLDAAVVGEPASVELVQILL